MSDQEKRELGRRLVETYNRRDTGELGRLIAEDAVWQSSRGDETGQGKTLGLLTSVQERSGGTFQLELHDVLATDEHLVMLTRATGRRGGKTINDPEVTVFRARDGRVREAWSFPFDPGARGAFWS